MNTCFFITSAIGVDNQYPFSYGNNVPRTAFSPDERLRQTIYSVNSIRLICPTAKIFVVDVSKDYSEYHALFAKLANVEYISCEKLSPALAETCRTSPSKGLCESLLTLCFLQTVNLAAFDYVIKLSGRYFYTRFDTAQLTNDNLDKYLVKTPVLFDWQDSWHFPKMLNKNKKLPYCYTQTYAVGRKNFEKFREHMQNISVFYIDNPVHANVDFEALFSYYVLTDNLTITVPWTCAGWNGSSGTYGES